MEKENQDSQKASNTIISKNTTNATDATQPDEVVLEDAEQDEVTPEPTESAPSFDMIAPEDLDQPEKIFESEIHQINTGVLTESKPQEALTVATNIANVGKTFEILLMQKSRKKLLKKSMMMTTTTMKTIILV